MSLEKELKREVKSIAKEINEIAYNEKIEEFLDNIIDIEIIKSPTEKQCSGFDILINFGGPNIRFEYNRGYAELIGSWGSVEYRKFIDPQVAEYILEYLNEILNC